MTRTQRLAVVVCLALVAVAASGNAERIVDSTWEKALEVFSSNVGWTPGRMEILTVDLDKNGIEKGSERRIMEMTVDADDQLRTEIISVEKDGKDITEKERGKQERNSGQNRGGEDFFPSPFNPALQDKVEWEPTATTSIVDGKRCREYAVRMHWEKKRYYVGTALIVEDTGVPLRFLATLDPLPMFVKNLQFRIEYNGDPEAWYVKSVSFEGRGTILLIDKRFRSSMSFDDYFRHPVP